MWTPALGGRGVHQFAVNQLFAPTATLADLRAFRSSPTAAAGVHPSVVVQLTSFVVNTGSETAPVIRTTFLPSITAATSEPPNGAPLMTPASSTDLLANSSTAGFQLNVQLQRNTLNIIVQQIQPNIFNLVVLIGSAAGSILSALVAVFKQLESHVGRRPRAHDAPHDEQQRGDMDGDANAQSAMHDPKPSIQLHAEVEQVPALPPSVADEQRRAQTALDVRDAHDARWHANPVHVPVVASMPRSAAAVAAATAQSIIEAEMRSPGRQLQPALVRRSSVDHLPPTLASMAAATAATADVGQVELVPVDTHDADDGGDAYSSVSSIALRRAATLARIRSVSHVLLGDDQ